jgi:hypothetical protein
VRIRGAIGLTLLCLAVTGCNGADAGELPPDARRFLDERFRGWRFATVIDAVGTKLPADCSPEWIEGDYDGDGTVDYAVQIVIPGPPEGQQLVLVLLRKGDGYELHTLKSFPIQQASYLRTSPKGEETMDVEKATRFVNATDTVNLLHGEDAGEAFIYENGRFRAVVAGD